MVPLLAWILAAPAPAQEVVRAGSLEARLPKDDGPAIVRDTRAGGDAAPWAAEVVVTEGIGEVPTGRDETIRLGRDVRTEGRHIRWRATVENRSKRQRLLDVKFALAARFDAPARSWDGHAVRPAGAGGLRKVLTQTFPMTCAYDETAGVALGLRPDTLCSWIEQGFEAQQPRDGRLSQAVRIVVDPGKSEAVEFILFGFEPRYGFLDALQVYYGEFPAWFCAAEGVDPRVTGGGATYQCWTGNSPEMCRRFFGDWEWCYAPFRRTGDWAGREELWDYQPARPFGKDRDLPRGEFLARRAAQFDRGKRCDTAMLFYLPANIWCEIQLANGRYKDAIVLREDASGAPAPIELHKPWVTGHDDELIVFPWATTFAEACKRDMRQVAAELNIAGFAFDTANGGTPYRGPGAAACPGRAWDERGVFVDLGIAVALMEEFAHTLRTRDGRRCALVSNPTGRTTWPVCFRSDSAMHEYAPYRQVDDQQSLRCLLGRKTLVWWDDYSAAPLLKWREMSPAEIREAWAGLADFVLLRSLYMGGIPTPRLTAGVPKLVRALPMIHEIVRAGWQPVPAFRPLGQRAHDAGLWASRYGDGLGTFLALGNATAADFDGEIGVDAAYLGGANLVFAPYGSGALAQTLARAGSRAKVGVAAREALAMKALLALPPDWEGAARVEQSADRLRIELERAEGGPARSSQGGLARLRVPPDAKLAALTAGGERIDFAAEPDAARFELPAAARCVIEASFEPRWLAPPREAILGFDFEHAGIVVPADPAPREMAAAEALREYFRFASTEIERRKKPLLLEIRRGANISAARGAIVIGSGRTRVEGGNLVVDPDPAAVRGLLGFLDRKYFFPGRFPASGENADEKELIEKSELGGKVLEFPAGR